jgi:hypothetical protein
MYQRRWLPALLLGLLPASPAGSKAAPNLSQMTECRLSLPAARALLSKMPPTGGDEYVIEDEHWVIRDYDSAAMHPLGKQATGFRYEAIGEDGETTHVLKTTVAARLSEVSPAMLALHGKKQCLQAFKAPIPSECFVSPGDAAKGKPGIWINERSGRVEIMCRYTLPS